MPPQICAKPRHSSSLLLSFYLAVVGRGHFSTVAFIVTLHFEEEDAGIDRRGVRKQICVDQAVDLVANLLDLAFNLCAELLDQFDVRDISCLALLFRLNTTDNTPRCSAGA